MLWFKVHKLKPIIHPWFLKSHKKKSKLRNRNNLSPKQTKQPTISSNIKLRVYDIIVALRLGELIKTLMEQIFFFWTMQTSLLFSSFLPLEPLYHWLLSFFLFYKVFWGWLYCSLLVSQIFFLVLVCIYFLL